MDYTKLFAMRDNIYLNAASSGIPSLRAVESAKQYIDIMSTNADVKLDEYFRIIDEGRHSCAKLINSKVKNIALINNTTAGVNIIKNAFQDIRNVVIYGRGFPCTMIPFSHDKRYSVDVISKNPENLSKMLSSAERSLVFLDMVDYLSGELENIREISDICHKYNSLICIDAIQGLGSVPVDIESVKCDFMFSGTSKWLLGPQGSGFIYVNEEHIGKTVLKNMGWLSLDYKDFTSFESFPEPRNDASGVESGTRNVIGIIMMKENINTLLKIGVREVYRHNIEGAKRIAEKLETIGSISQPSNELKTSIVSLKSKAIKNFYGYLTEHNVTVSFRDGHIRTAYHIFNNDADIDRFFAVIDEYKSAEWKK